MEALKFDLRKEENVTIFADTVNSFEEPSGESVAILKDGSQGLSFKENEGLSFSTNINGPVYELDNPIKLKGDFLISCWFSLDGLGQFDIFSFEGGGYARVTIQKNIELKLFNEKGEENDLVLNDDEWNFLGKNIEVVVQRSKGTLYVYVQDENGIMGTPKVIKYFFDGILTVKGLLGNKANASGIIHEFSIDVDGIETAPIVDEGPSESSGPPAVETVIPFDPSQRIHELIDERTTQAVPIPPHLPKVKNMNLLSLLGISPEAINKILSAPNGRSKMLRIIYKELSKEGEVDHNELKLRSYEFLDRYENAQMYYGIGIDKSYKTFEFGEINHMSATAEKLLHLLMTDPETWRERIVLLRK